MTNHTAPDIFAKYGLDAETLLQEAKKTALAAGKELMAVYNAAANDEDAMKIEIKADNSPVTIADKKSSALIEAQLSKLTPAVTVVSEENSADPDPQSPHWTIDPLDGTKLFIGRTGGFAVNIALMLDGRPVLGVVHCPALGVTYFAHEGGQAYKMEDGKAPEVMTSGKAPKKGDLKAAFDMAHAKAETYEAAFNGLTKRGIAIPAQPETGRLYPHNLMVADAKLDAHIKTGKDIAFNASSGHPWDNAADFVILQAAGGIMVELHKDDDGNVTAAPMKWDNVRGKMRAYASFGDKDMAMKKFPELKAA